ncbi:MAG: pro-sigmaK processing inhibitor BofA family protein [Candidatus Anstonellaceae archaeon]
MGYGLLIALGISILLFYLLYRVVRRIVPLIVHGIFGIAVFWLLNYLGLLRIPIDAITFLIGAFGGTLGVVVVILLAYFGVPL